MSLNRIMESKIKNQISVDNYFSDNQGLLRRINTCIFYYLGFFVCGLILIIVAASIRGKGVTYQDEFGNILNNHSNATSVLNNASTALFTVGGLFIGMPIIINLYVIAKIRQTDLLKSNVSKSTCYLLISGIILQITTFIGMILLYQESKKIYKKINTN